MTEGGVGGNGFSGQAGRFVFRRDFFSITGNLGNFYEKNVFPFLLFPVCFFPPASLFFETPRTRS